MAPNIMSGNSMTVRTRVGTPSPRERIDVRVDGQSQPNITALNSLAVGSLVSLFDKRKKLFSARATWNQSGVHREEVSGRLTAIALLGLQRLVSSGAGCPIDIFAAQEAVWNDRSWVRGVGDLGLLTWFVAACRPEWLDNLFREYDFGGAIASFADAREARTTELALFLAGIAHARLACANTPVELTDVAVEAYHLLQTNQGDRGIFGHAASHRFLPHYICNRFGTFADQIYAIYSLTIFARAFQIEEPLEPALSCANSLRGLQGELGQWWFLYDKSACRVANRYPVRSEHQDGMAPLALLALGEATRQSFHESVYKGLSWITGKNELEHDLREPGQRLIWDSIGPNGRELNLWEAALSLANISHEPRAETLRVRYEVRPAHFAWLLCAFGSHGLPKAMSATAYTQSR